MAGIWLQLAAKVSVAIATIAGFLGAIVTICVDVCLGSKKGKFLGEAVTAYLPSGSNKVKVWRGWSGFLLVGYCGWVVTLGSAGVEIC